MADSKPASEPSSSEKPTQGKKVQPQGVQLLPLLVKYFKNSAFLIGVYTLGYFNFSSTWVMLGLFFYMLSSHYKKIKATRKAYAREAMQNEREAILARTEELPSWVFFPDVERAEWLNKMLMQLWPYIGVYVKGIMKNSVEPSVNNSLPKSLQPFKFETINLGAIPPRIGGIKVYTKHVRRDEIIMDLEIFYASDCNIKVAVRGISSGIKDLQIHGTVRVVMKPLCSVMPLIGGMNIFFLNSPTIDFDLTDAANILDFPLLSDTLRTVMEDQIAYYMVLPNKIPIQLVEGIDMSKLKFPHPQGVLRVQVAAARELKAADYKLIGKAKSDPYCKIYIGAETFKTKVIKDTIDPVWNEYYEAVIEQKHGQFAEIDVLDEDPGDDDELGTASIDVQLVAQEGDLDTWLPLEGVATGMIHIRALWLHLSRDPAELDKSYNEQMKSGTEDHLSSALLMVHVDSAHSLPRSKKSMKEPSPMVKLTIGNDTKKTIAQQRTVDPKWEENFQFLIHDPAQQELSLEVRDSDKDKKLGILSYQLKNLLKVPDMTINTRPFLLQNSGPEAKINLRLVLRILTSERPPDWARDEPVGLSEDITAGAPKPQNGTDVDTGKADTEDQQPAEAKSVETVSAQSSPPVEAKDKGGFYVSDSDKDNVSQSSSVNEKPDTELRQRKVAAPTDTAGPDLGKMQMTIRYSPQRNKLILVVHRCQNLLACDDNNLSDPYVRIYMLPDRSSSNKRKTQVVKDNLNPIYDETFDWSMNATEVATKSLEVMVKNQVGMFSKNKTKMGQVILDLSKLDLTKATTDWYHLQECEEDD